MVTAVAFVGLVGGCATMSVEPATTPDRLELPAPTGRASIGTVRLHLIDEARDDPSRPGSPREVLVQLWYPAQPAGEPAPCFDPPVAQAAGIAMQCHTHGYESAPAAGGGDPYPLVLYSPGWGSSRSFGTALVEELASHGYVVAAVDHPYDAMVVAFPDGKVVAEKPEQQEPPTDLAGSDRQDAPLVATRSADIRFALDALADLAKGGTDADGRVSPDGLAEALDLSRVGMFGHSMGGSTTAQVLLEDPRVAAGLLLDSIVPLAVREQGVDRPIMLWSSEQPDPQAVIDTAWEQLRPRGWHRWLRLSGSGHNTFTDLAVYCSQLGPDCDPQADGVGAIDGQRAMQIERAYVTAFFDHHLKNTDQPLLDGPSPDFPEVKFLP